MGPHTEDRSHAVLGAVLRFLIRICPQSAVTMRWEDKAAGEGRAILV